MKGGFNVTTSETHGLSQRGGKVVCFLRFGNKRKAPIPMIGSADLIIAAEKSTILDVLKYSKPDKSSILIVSAYERRVINVDYPSEEFFLKILNVNSDKNYILPVMRIVEKYQNLKIINMTILGYILKYLPMNKEELEDSIKNYFSGESLKLNLIALKDGYDL
ncbi:hypothetical protein LCGC14_1586240 [marine sediment metagenome]|uniref:Pyruvate/ketoisovalerate oxidoreductase catalytic domain-containing protein n=1 Tax=marine sediment metagenome TaxID=412755 RepID=A0A0F9IFL7_9ZZZZ